MSTTVYGSCVTQPEDYSTFSGDVTSTSGGAITLANPQRILVSTKSLNNTGAAVDGAIVGVAAGSIGHASGVTLVAGVADKVIVIEKVLVNFTYATAAYTDGGNVSVKYDGGSDCSSAATAGNTFGSASSLITTLNPAAGAALVATGVVLVAAAGFSDPGTAAGTAVIKTYYRLVDAT